FFSWLQARPGFVHEPGGVKTDTFLPRSLLLVVPALLLAACAAGAEPSTTAPQREASRQATMTRRVLADATEAARAYGQAHLGHVLHLSPRDLRKKGLELPEGIALDIRTNHTSFCIRVTNGSLPSIHPWATGTVSSSARSPSSSDRCHL
ncbi:MAG: hypothetical protein LC808_39230, partial [Actinobacteria bacterium]|nr:hypothetical protein [Actinomycetota bacterium]